MDEHLSPHFMRSEFENEGPMPDSCVSAYTDLCRMLETIRSQFGNNPVEITSGYRSKAVNEKEHGVLASQHVATSLWCAADFAIGPWLKDMRPIFDWLRLRSGLEFDQIILEHGTESDIIHISWVAGLARREALEGSTYNASGYVSWPVTPVDLPMVTDVELGL